MTEWPKGTVSGRYSDQRPNIDKQESQSYQEIWQECFDALINADLSDIEQRIMHNTRGTSKSTMWPYCGTSSTYYIHDEYHDIKKTVVNSGPKKRYWTQSIPTADPFNKPVSDPSQAKRAKLRAKRKKR
jgi:hypothetical protein